MPSSWPFCVQPYAEGRDQVQTFLTRKWSKEQGYRLKKHLWAFQVCMQICILARVLLCVSVVLKHWHSFQCGISRLA